MCRATELVLTVQIGVFAFCLLVNRGPHASACGSLSHACPHAADQSFNRQHCGHSVWCRSAHKPQCQAPSHFSYNVRRPSKVRSLQGRPLCVCPSLGLSVSPLSRDVLRADMPRTRTGHECSRSRGRRTYASEMPPYGRMVRLVARGSGQGARGPGGPGRKGGSGRGALLLENDLARADPAGPDAAAAAVAAFPRRAVRVLSLARTGQRGSAPAWQRVPGAPGWPAPHVAGGASTATTQMATGDRSVAPGNAQLTCRACFAIASHPVEAGRRALVNCSLVCPFSRTPAVCIF